MGNKRISTACVLMGMGLAAAALIVSAPSGNASAAAAKGTTAVAVIHGTQGNEKVSGTIKFVQTDKGVEIEAHVMGLPDGKHGFHIHEFGDTSAADGASLGGHFNPHGKPHGSPDMGGERHAGDLGNIESKGGHAEYKRVDNVIELDGANCILGRGFVVHGGEDDCTTQPTGNAGARLGVGVIGVAKAAS